MNYRIIALLLVLTLISPVWCEEEDQKEEEGTQLIYFVEEDGEQDQDFIQITVLIKTYDTSLSAAIKNAGRIADSVEDAVQKYCQKEQDGKDCDEAIQVGKEEIEAKYQLIRKVLQFKQFIVSREATIKLTNTEKIGSLVDKIISCQVQEISEITWIPEDEKDSGIQALQEGLQQGKDMCKMIGQKFSKVISVEEVQEEEEQEEEPQQGQEQEEEEQEAPPVYQFTVLCVPK